MEPVATHPLHRLPFEWHDLCVGRISIIAKGVLIDVIPFNDSANRYDHASLSLLDAESTSFDIKGEFSIDVLDQLEITDFDFAVSASGRITGSLGILSGNHLYWTIGFRNAVWRVDEHGPAAAQFPDYT